MTWSCSQGSLQIFHQGTRGRDSPTCFKLASSYLELLFFPKNQAFAWMQNNLCPLRWRRVVWAGHSPLHLQLSPTACRSPSHLQGYVQSLYRSGRGPRGPVAKESKRCQHSLRTAPGGTSWPSPPAAPPEPRSQGPRPCRRLGFSSEDVQRKGGSSVAWFREFSFLLLFPFLSFRKQARSRRQPGCSTFYFCL